MSILVSNEIYTAICQEIESAKESVQILSAYGKINAVGSLIERIPESVENKRIMLRFRLDDLLKGSTDFELLDYCMNQGWDVFIRFDLHAKTYIVDNKRGIIGSANATTSGLALNRNPNYEMAALVDIEEEDVLKINKLFNDAILVDDNLWIDLSAEYNAAKRGVVDSETHQWSSKIISNFHPQIEPLFSYELPEASSFSIGQYIQFLDMPFTSKEELKATFRWSRAYMWLLEVLKENDGVLYFGTLSAKLHDALVSDPKPYRKDVKELLSNLLELATNLGMEEITVDRPNHSQRVRLNSNIGGA